MALQGHALYDFEANEEHGELSLQAGDQVTVHRQDIGEGWWEGEVSGRRGLFPASYVQVDEGEDALDDGMDDHFDDDDDGSDWDDDSGDEWDDEPGHHEHFSQHQMTSQQHAEAQPPGLGMTSAADYAGEHAQTYGGPASSYGRAGTLKKSVYRFSIFVKAGAEAFLIGATKDVTIDANNMLHIQQTPDGPSWIANPEPYPEIDVQHDGSRSKYKGIKTYEAYNIINAKPGVQVERRYKHFAWLHDRLVDKYSCLCVPPLPSKDYSQKFGESLVDKRQDRLKMWLNRICRHPVLSRDQLALRHFLMCPTSDKTAWKDGKRKAEKDQFVNSMFFKLISQDVPCPNDSDKEIEQFEKFVTGMIKAVKRNLDIASRFSDRMAGSFKNEYTRVSSGLEMIGQTFSQSGGQVNGDSVRLSAAFVAAAASVKRVAELYAAQPVEDQIPWMEGLKEYNGLLGQFSGCTISSRSASLRVEEIENNEEAKPGEKDAVRSRCDVIHTLALCEMSHFHQQRRSDFRDMMKRYFAAQIEFHQKIMDQLAAAKAEFDQLDF